MVTLAQKFNWGQQIIEKQPELFRRLNEAYSDTAQVVNTKVTKVKVTGSNPPANSPFNRNFEIGDIYVRPDTNSAWIMTSRTDDTNVIWTIIT